MLKVSLYKVILYKVKHPQYFGLTYSFCFCDQDCYGFKDCCSDFADYCTLPASKSISSKETQSMAKTRIRRKDFAPRACPACSLIIMNLSWCIWTIRDKHDLHYHPECCLHPRVIAKNPGGMKCRCCKLGIAEHCRTWKPWCNIPQRYGF